MGNPPPPPPYPPPPPSPSSGGAGCLYSLARTSDSHNSIPDEKLCLSYQSWLWLLYSSSITMRSAVTTSGIKRREKKNTYSVLQGRFSMVSYFILSPHAPAWTVSPSALRPRAAWGSTSVRLVREDWWTAVCSARSTLHNVVTCKTPHTPPASSRKR